MTTKVFTDDEQRTICNAPSKRSPSGRRDRAMLVLMFHTGLRVSEVTHLRIKDVMWDEPFRGQVSVVRGAKGGKRRGVKVGPEVMAELDYYRRRSPHVDNADLNTGGLLFPSARGKVLTRHHVWRMFQRQAERAGITRHVHPHMARHTAASRGYAVANDVKGVQEFLGHSSVAVTDTYVHSLTDSGLPPLPFIA